MLAHTLSETLGPTAYFTPLGGHDFRGARFLLQTLVLYLCPIERGVVSQSGGGLQPPVFVFFRFFVNSFVGLVGSISSMFHQNPYKLVGNPWNWAPEARGGGGSFLGFPRFYMDFDGKSTKWSQLLVEPTTWRP